MIKNIENEINDFVNEWDLRQMMKFVTDIAEIYHLYDCDDEQDWVKDEVGEENAVDVRLIRTVYLLSKLADEHSPKLATVKFKFNKLWKRLEKISH